MNLKSMLIDKLSKLKDQIDLALAAKVADRRRALESELSKLTHFKGAASRSYGRGTFGKVAPKYRNPDNPAETWAGRGLKPRWLAAALKTGKKLEHFSIASPGKAVPKMARKKPGKAGRKARAKKTRSPRASLRPRLASASGSSAAGTAQA